MYLQLDRYFQLPVISYRAELEAKLQLLILLQRTI